MAPASDPARRTVRDVPVAATVCLIAIGLLFTVLAIVYFAFPAHDLPGLIPGSDKGVTRHHVKHGLASLASGVAALLAAAFSAGQRPVATPSQRAARRAGPDARDAADPGDADARRAEELQRADDLLWEDVANVDPATPEAPAPTEAPTPADEEASSGQR
ncbi:MAG: hypothetical protein ACQSGP_04570 [Frankia sp.]